MNSQERNTIRPIGNEHLERQVMKLRHRLLVGLTAAVFVASSSINHASAAEGNESPDAAPVDTKEAFQKALEYTRAVVEKQHMVCLVDIDSLNGGKKRSFRYDHYPEVERIQMKNGATFARKKDQHWLRSDDWAETGTKVNPNRSDELDSLVDYPFVALDDKRSTHDQTQGAVVVRLIKREEVEDTERLYYEEGREKQTGFDYPQFIFSKLKKEPDEKALLEGWAGMMRNDAERTHVNMNFSFLFQINAQETTSGRSETPSPSAEEKPAAPIGGASAADLLTETRKSSLTIWNTAASIIPACTSWRSPVSQAHSPTIVTLITVKSAFAAMRERLLASIQGSPG